METSAPAGYQGVSRRARPPNSIQHVNGRINLYKSRGVVSISDKTSTFGPDHPFLNEPPLLKAPTSLINDVHPTGVLAYQIQPCYLDIHRKHMARLSWLAVAQSHTSQPERSRCVPFLIARGNTKPRRHKARARAPALRLRFSKAPRPAQGETALPGDSLRPCSQSCIFEREATLDRTQMTETA